MKRIIKIGMDVHSATYTLHAMEPRLDGEDLTLGTCTVEAQAENVVDFISKLRKKITGDAEFECGYEAGCLGFSLYNELTAAGVKCVILAPTTMLSQQNRRVRQTPGMQR